LEKYCTLYFLLKKDVKKVSDVEKIPPVKMAMGNPD
jgi:general stress protein 26